MTTTTTDQSTRNNSTNRVNSTTPSNELTNRILQEGNGKGLLKFCRELAVILINRYSIEDDAAHLRGTLSDSLIASLNCSKTQSESLIDLSLEMIHYKIHGKYRRSALDLSYLIAQASGVVGDIASN